MVQYCVYYVTLISTENHHHHHHHRILSSVCVFMLTSDNKSSWWSFSSFVELLSSLVAVIGSAVPVVWLAETGCMFFKQEYFWIGWQLTVWKITRQPDVHWWTRLFRPAAKTALMCVQGFLQDVKCWSEDAERASGRLAAQTWWEIQSFQGQSVIFKMFYYELFSPPKTAEIFPLGSL